MIVKPLNKLGFLIPLLSSLIMLAACQSVAEEKMALSIADLYENASQTQQAIPGLDTQPLLSKMHLHVIALQNELKSLDKRIEKTQASRSTQTGIMLNDSIFERLILEMNELQKAMKPLCQELEGVSLPFDLNSFETAMPETGCPNSVSGMAVSKLLLPIKTKNDATFPTFCTCD